MHVVNQSLNDKGLLFENLLQICWITKHCIWVLQQVGPWGLMVKRMTLLLHLRNLFVTKSPVICHILALGNSSSERRKMSMKKGSNRKDLKTKIWGTESSDGIIESRTSVINCRSEITDSGYRNTEVRELCITERSSNDCTRVNVPAVAPTISCSLLFLMFNSFLPQPPQFCILGKSIKMHATTSLYCFLLQPCT